MADFPRIFRLLPRPSAAIATRADADEPLFDGLFSALALAGGLFALWVTLTPPPARAALPDLSGVSVLVTDLPRIVLPIPVVHVLEVPRFDDAPPRARRPAPVTPSASPGEAPRRAGAPPSIIGTLGAPTGALAEVLDPADEGMRRLGEALDNVHADEIAGLGMAFRGSRRSGDREVGLGTADEGRTGTGAGATVVRAVVEDTPEPPSVDQGDAAEIASLVRAQTGRIETCVTQSLKRSPTMSGRVEAAWEIRAGRVSGARVVANNTGDAELGACVTRAVRSFRFPASLDAEVLGYPWVVSGR